MCTHYQAVKQAAFLGRQCNARQLEAGRHADRCAAAAPAMRTLGGQTHGVRMPRLNKIAALSPAERQRVDHVVRASNYYNMDGMKAQLSEMGIEVSRSALFRYVGELKKRDAGVNVGVDQRLIVIMDRSTGLVTTITKESTVDQIVGLLSPIP